MSTDFSSLTGGPRAPVNTASASTGKNVVALRPVVRQEIAAPAGNAANSAARPAQEVSATPASGAERTSQQVEDDAQALRAKVEELNQTAQSIKRSLRFDIDDGTGITVITVRDRETEEVIRQIPSEEMLALARYFAESNGDKGDSKGLLLRAEV